MLSSINMNKIIYSEKPLFSTTGSNTIILATVSLQPLVDTSESVQMIKDLYPAAFKDYALTTEEYKQKKIGNSLLGKVFWFGYPDCKQRVALIYVSKQFGKWRDPIFSIRERTLSGLSSLLTNLSPAIEIHCDKLNKANFGIVWPETRKTTNDLLEKFPKHKIIVHAKLN